MTWERDDARQLFIGRGTGVLTAEDVLPALPTRSVVDRIASNPSSERDTRGHVAIAADNPTFFGLARTYQIVCENAGLTNVGVFSTVGEAMTCLGLPDRSELARDPK